MELRAGRIGVHESETHLPGGLLAQHRPACGQRRQLLAARHLEVDTRACGQPAAAKQCTQLGEIHGTEGRIEKYQVERPCYAGEEAPCVGHDDLRALRTEAAQALLQQPGDARLALDEARFGSTARQGLQAEHASACKQVEAAHAGNDRCEPVEQGLAHPVTARPYRGLVAHRQAAPAPGATDDAHRAWLPAA